MAEALWQCPTCGVQREFEQPPCLDGHGPDCPEWSCVTCGHAIVVDFTLEIENDDVIGRAA